jgi:hypothetical protein
MDLLFRYTQTKKDKKSNCESKCEITLFSDDKQLYLNLLFDLDYHRYGTKKIISFDHSLSINKNNGDFIVGYKISNNDFNIGTSKDASKSVKKNDFYRLTELCDNALTRGEKRTGYWGVRYDRAVNEVCELINNSLSPYFISDHLKRKNFKNDHVIGFLYDLIVDFHLEIKGIKGHNNVYHDIQNSYPLKKWLKKNDNKFLPSVLDSFGIKSKYLISELSGDVEAPINLSSLNYICKLFGEDYLNYLKQIPWKNHCYEKPPTRKTFELKTQHEKKSMVSLITNWDRKTYKSDSLIYNLNKILNIREQLEKKDFKLLKFKAKDDYTFQNLLGQWMGIKTHLSKGFKMRYNVPDHFIFNIQEEIKIGENIFKPKLILTEEEFRYEGFIMKNCMSKQFQNGTIYTYVSLQSKSKRINLQYKKGQLIQSYGKANTKISDFFIEALNILNDRFKKYKDIQWSKEKYDILK